MILYFISIWKIREIIKLAIYWDWDISNPLKFIKKFLIKFYTIYIYIFFYNNFEKNFRLSYKKKLLQMIFLIIYIKVKIIWIYLPYNV